MKLYYSPGACSLGIHVILEETGQPYQTELVNLREGAQYKPEFVTVNPKSKVPTLERDDGSVLTEYPAIAVWLARGAPEAGLLPSGRDAEAAALEATDYAVSTMHMQGFSRIFRPSNFAPSAADEEQVKERGREIFARGFALMDRALAGREWLAGTYSIADTALFYNEFWAAGRLGMTLPGNCAAHYARMLARPAVQRVMQHEGLA